MSSHREAPEISKDPVADSTDVYAFVSPDAPGTVTLIANYLPFQNPAGGPNFYEFGDDVRYEIHIDNDGDGKADITYQFRFTTKVRNAATFLYNTGPIESLDSMNWNRRQFYTVTRVEARTRAFVLARDLPCPPCNVGPLSTPKYAALAQAAVRTLPGGRRVFAGQRAEGFYVDLGSIFDLGNLRPFQKLHALGMNTFSGAGTGVNATDGLNVHSIAIQVPLADLRRKGLGAPKVTDAHATIGVWTSASRRQARLLRPNTGTDVVSGPFVQVSRLGNPLFNEVIVPMARKDFWNAQEPSGDQQFAANVEQPELAALLPTLYPKVFPKLAAIVAAKKPRADLAAILLTGIPAGLIPGFQNYTGSTKADMLRLNTAIPPSEKPNVNGLLGGDLAGFPNGRRVADDVVAIELRAIAGATYGLVDKTFTADAAAASVDDGVTPADVKAPYLHTFPYLGVPYDGYSSPS